MLATALRKFDGNSFEPGGNDEPLRRQLAKSMCRSYDIADTVDGFPCERYIPCKKRSVCTEMADNVLAFAQSLHDERKEKKTA